jgi:hypothetical protein
LTLAEAALAELIERLVEPDTPTDTPKHKQKDKPPAQASTRRRKT